MVQLFRFIKFSNFFRQGQTVRREQKSSAPVRSIDRSSTQTLKSPIPIKENLYSQLQTFQKLPPQLPVKDEQKISKRSLQDSQNGTGETQDSQETPLTVNIDTNDPSHRRPQC